MTKQPETTSGKKKFQILVGIGSACLVLGFLLAFTVIGLPLGILFGIAGVILIIVAFVFKAKHLVRSRERLNER